MAEQIGLSRRGFLSAAAVASAVPVVAHATSASAEASAPDAGGSVVRVSDYNPDPADSTAALQAAFDADADTVVVDKIPDGYTSGPLFVRRSGVRIEFEPGVMIRSLEGGFPGSNDCLLTVADQHDVTLSGYGAVLAMNKPEYKTGEWRMALKLQSVRDTVVEGLTLRDSGGDGIYVGRGAAAYCENVTIRDVVCDDNRRQGMSVITADGLTVEGCAFLNTNGTAPQRGVDCEPNHEDERLKDVVFRDCVFDGNLSGGWSCYFAHLTADSTPVSITVDRTTIGRQIGGSPSVTITSKGEVGGSIEFKDSLFDVGAGSGAYGLLDKPAGAMRAVMSRSTIWDVGNSFYYYGPITVASGSLSKGLYPAYGSADFNDCVVVSDLAAPFFKAYDGGDGNALTDVHGTITVADPNGTDVDFGANPTDVDLAVRTEQPGAATPVRVSASQRQVAGGDPVELVFTRLGGDLRAPLAIAYATSGTARERYDYGGLGKVAVIAPGERETRVPVRTFARRQDSDPARRQLVVSIAPGHRYAAAHRPASVEIAIV